MRLARPDSEECTQTRCSLQQVETQLTFAIHYETDFDDNSFQVQVLVGLTVTRHCFDNTSTLIHGYVDGLRHKFENIRHSSQFNPRLNESTPDLCLSVRLRFLSF